MAVTTIKAGTITHALRGTCGRCGGEFECEKSDLGRTQAAVPPDPLALGWIQCPTPQCGMTVYIRKVRVAGKSFY